MVPTFLKDDKYSIAILCNSPQGEKYIPKIRKQSQWQSQLQ